MQYIPSNIETVTPPPPPTNMTFTGVFTIDTHSNGFYSERDWKIPESESSYKVEGHPGVGSNMHERQDREENSGPGQSEGMRKQAKGVVCRTERAYNQMNQTRASECVTFLWV